MKQHELQQFADGMISWLKNSPICSPDGAVYSWINSDKSGYIYPEIIGYYIKLFSYLYKTTGKEEYLENAVSSADYLSVHLNEDGSVGRGEYKYVFDTAICISGLVRLSMVTKLEKEHKMTLSRMIDFVYSSLQKKELVYNGGKAFFDNDRWSLSYGSLLIKNAMALHEAADYFKEDKYKELADSMVSEIIEKTFHDNYFTINGNRNFVYTHPHCYATEGLIFLISRGYKHYLPLLQKSAEWLAENQDEDGSMYNWYLRNDVIKEKQGDATAQAIRIWLFTDKEKFANEIRKGTFFLKKLQTEEGGLTYNISTEGRSRDVNSWVTMFAVQALLWQYTEPDWEWIA